MGKTRCGMVCVDGMVREKQYQVYGMVRLRYGMVCVDCMVREKQRILWYGTFAVWYHGTVS